MGAYSIKRTFNTPEIYFSAEEGLLRIEGRSIPEDPGELFETLIEKVTEYFEKPKELTTVEIKLEYVNSGSSKYLLELFRVFKRNYDKGKNCIVNWHYEEDDESIFELGQHYQNTVQVPFKLIDYY
jgi:hypothetical protein